MTDYVGRQFGNYHLLRLLGEGNFAAVYLGEHRYLERPAAIKVLRVQMEVQAHETFRLEARTIAHLDHPHIVRVLDYGVEDQLPYLVMDYIPNGTLRTLHPRGTRLSFEQILLYARQIASALDYAHTQHVIHRDVKPENVLLNSKGDIVLSDFGIAVVQHTLNALSTQNMAGTPLYMAPEQIQRHPCPASDQYALAVMVYEWLCGEPPFPGPGAAVFGQHLYQDPPVLRVRVPELPPAVEDAVFGALAKDPARRFVTVQDFAIALEEACFATQPLSFKVSTENTPQELDDPTLPLPTMRAHYSPLAMRPAAQPISPLAGHRSSMLSGPPLAMRPTVQPVPPLVAQHLLVAPQRPQQALAPSSIARRNRQALLRKVYSIWINGVLSHSLHGAALISLGLQAQPGVVADPWQLVLQHPEETPYPLPAGTPISKIYDEACGELLILGTPGAGKTTLLLELARELLAKAETDEHLPLPIVFPLSSWADKQLPLQDWLVEELRFKYQVPPKLARALISADLILPLLDGLDEVATTARTACIETINAFRQEHGLLPLVVCSRSADYLSQTTRIQLRTAVMIQPLTPQQVDAYLASGKGALHALRLAWHHDATLRELTSTPLMLSLMVLTYQGVSPAELMQHGSLAERQHQIFEHYVTRMLQRSGPSHRRYSSEQTMRRLSWLARQLSQRNQTAFYIEQLQPDWLPSRSLHWLYTALAVRSVDAFIGLWVGILGSFLCAGIVKGVGLLICAATGLIIGLFSRRGYPVRAQAGSSTLSWLKYVRIGPFLAGLAMTPLAAFFDLFNEGTTDPLQLAKSACLGALIGLVIGILLSLRSLSIQPVEIVAWSWSKFIRVRHLYTGLLVGLGVGVLDWWFFSYKSYVLLYALFWSIGGWLISALLSSFSNERLDDRHRLVPNQGVQYSARNGRRLGCLVGLASGLIYTLAIKLIYDSMHIGMYSDVYAISYGVICALGVGLLSWLFSGGDASIKHRILRCFLWIARVIPWNLSGFLDYAAECTLLCRVGGGYIFTHRLLLDYFSSLAQKPIASIGKVPIVKKRKG